MLRDPHMGCSQNYGPLLVMDYSVGPPKWELPTYIRLLVWYQGYQTSFSLNSSKKGTYGRIIEESSIGVLKRDTRSLDYSSYHTGRSSRTYVNKPLGYDPDLRKGGRSPKL